MYTLKKVDRVVSNHYKTQLETFYTCLKDFKIVHRFIVCGNHVRNYMLKMLVCVIWDQFFRPSSRPSSKLQRYIYIILSEV